MSSQVMANRLVDHYPTRVATAADPVLRKDERTIIEPAGNEVWSIFEVHKISERIARLEVLSMNRGRYGKNNAVGPAPSGPTPPHELL